MAEGHGVCCAQDGQRRSLRSVQAEHFRYAAFLANLKSNLSSAFVTHVSRGKGRGRGRW